MPNVHARSAHAQFVPSKTRASRVRNLRNELSSGKDSRAPAPNTVYCALLTDNST